MTFDLSFGQILQALIVAALLGIARSVWNAGLAFERIKSWADNHEKMDDLRFEGISRQLDRIIRHTDEYQHFTAPDPRD